MSAYQDLMTALVTRRPDQSAAEDERIVLAALAEHAHGLAERQRAHIPYGSTGHAAEVSWQRHALYGMAGETFEAQRALDAFGQGVTKELADLIDPQQSAGPVRPGEEPTT